MMRSIFKTSSIVILVILLLSACQTNHKPIHTSNSSKGEWPSYNIEEIIEMSDLIAYLEVEETKNVNGTPSYQESKLKVIQILKGNKDVQSVTLNLSDSDYYVTPDSKYFMFLSDMGHDLTQVSYNSIIEETNGEFITNIKGLQGTFDIEEISNKITQMMK